MKNRLVLCINVAVYVFSALVLACSAFSYFQMTTLACGTDQSRILVRSGLGNIVWLQWPRAHIGEIEFQSVTIPRTMQHVEQLHPFLRHSTPTSHDRHQYLGVTFIAQAKEQTFWDYVSLNRLYYPERIWVVPYFTLLIPPIVWMSSFYLFKLWQRFRKRSVSFQPGAPCVPSE
jgi:hypothetical protein